MTITYTNPVWAYSMADPFVLKWQGEYYAYGTANSESGCIEEDGLMFPLLHSTDLVNWRKLGRALIPLPGAERLEHWAPAVAEQDGMFYLYYSVEGINGRLHQLRVAIAQHPAGPFVDSGNVLLPNIPFTIDAHPFRDPKDDRWYLYFADELMEGSAIGTGVMGVPLSNDLLSVVGEPISLLRGKARWQIHWYDVTKHGRQFEQWYTLEGPCVVEHAGRYYCFYSGGAWEDETYGVSYAVADHPLGPFYDDWSAEGPVILRTIPNKVIGPGHNSITVGPDDQTPIIVYHAWDVAYTARMMCIDRLEWTENGPRCAGPTYTPQTLEEKAVGLVEWLSKGLK